MSREVIQVWNMFSFQSLDRERCGIRTTLEIFLVKSVFEHISWQSSDWTVRFYCSGLGSVPGRVQILQTTQCGQNKSQYLRVGFNCNEKSVNITMFKYPKVLHSRLVLKCKYKADIHGIVEFHFIQNQVVVCSWRKDSLWCQFPHKLLSWFTDFHANLILEYK